MTSGPPRVSVIMAAYNGERYIAESLRSALGQTYPHLEVVVVDDGSADRTREIVADVRATDGRVVYVYQPNGKQGKARNTGIRRARGELIAFLDQDDLWEAEKLELQLRAIAASGADVVFSDGYLFEGDQAADERAPFNTIRGRYVGDEMLRLLFATNSIPVLSALVRRGAIVGAGLLNADPAFQNCDDYDLWLRLAARGAVFYGMPERLVRYRRHPGQASRQITRQLKSEIAVLEQFRDSPAIGARAKRERLWPLYQQLVLALVEEGQPEEAREWLRKLSAAEPRVLFPALQARLLTVGPRPFRIATRAHASITYRLRRRLDQVRGAMKKK